MVFATKAVASKAVSTWGKGAFPLPLLTAVGVGCVAAVWSMGRNLAVNPEVCCTKAYRGGDSLWNDEEIRSKSDQFRPFPFILRMMAKLGKASTPSGEWSQ
ncbi:hypothetical protein N2152v2_003325 [Parachlorella kessleri]